METNGLLDRIDIALTPERHFQSINMVVLRIKISYQGKTENYKYDMPVDEFNSCFDRIYEQAGRILKRKILEDQNL